ncbi:MAG: 30S ribosomal protein S9 [Candidatus Marinimicrobia bacterium]|nr:30S ribosomal protein S9 [Candidatus Neomarinimicrobiota bacterium]
MKEEFIAVGRRKASVARVIVRPGTGKILINNRELNDYFDRDCHKTDVMSPLVLTETATKYDYLVNVQGGGQTGQAGAIKMAFARALDKSDGSLRGKLKTAGMLTRDARVVERKKFGLAGARRGYQFSKR